MVFFFFNDTATTEIYTLSLHDALPICAARFGGVAQCQRMRTVVIRLRLIHLGAEVDESQPDYDGAHARSEEHTSELQSHSDLVCRLLLEKKKEADMDGASVSK